MTEGEQTKPRLKGFCKRCKGRKDVRGAEILQQSHISIHSGAFSLATDVTHMQVGTKALFPILQKQKRDILRDLKELGAAEGLDLTSELKCE